MKTRPLNVQRATAEERYAAHLNRARVALDSLREAIDAEDKNLGTGQIHWGHVGSMEHVADELEQLLKFAGAWAEGE